MLEAVLCLAILPQAPHVDPYRAYEEKKYEQALQSFVDMQVEKPNDAALMLNIGDVHYKMNNFEEAQKSFAQAVTLGNADERAEANYNLGNCAFRAGKLDEAIAHYQATLAIHPNDADAKFNLEFTRDEIRRRHEAAQKQAEQKNKSPPQTPNNPPKASDNPSEKPQNGSPQDSDKDGLSDAQEKSAANPTDPKRADTDGDGRRDGDEDANKNGKVDPGETDPRKPDTGAANKKGDAPTGQAGAMTKEQAERYLNSLEENRPKIKAPAGRTSRGRNGKDW